MEKTNYPHITWLAKYEGKKDEAGNIEGMPPYLVKKIGSFTNALNNFESLKTKSDDDELILQTESKLIKLSQDIADDLDSEFNDTEGLLDIDTITFAHQKAMDNYDIKNFEDFPIKIQEQSKNFAKKHNYVKNYHYSSTEEQKKDVDDLHAKSHQLKKDIVDFVQKKTNERIDDAKQKQRELQLRKKREEMAHDMVNKIKSHIDKKEWDQAELQVDAISSLSEQSDDLDFSDIIEEQKKFISESKDNHFAELRKKMKPVNYLDKITADGIDIISTKDLLEMSVELPDASWDIPMISQTEFEIGGKYILKAQPFTEEWGISLSNGPIEPTDEEKKQTEKQQEVAQN